MRNTAKKRKWAIMEKKPEIDNNGKRKLGNNGKKGNR